MSRADVHEQMRRDWNDRAQEDAHYYVAFGRRHQGEEEFFATASDVLRNLRGELKRLGDQHAIKRARLLEIGCGPARLVKPLAQDCAEIHGVDVSDEMVTRGRLNLAGVSNAWLHRVPGSDLKLFEDSCFDFVFSYAVFQHVPEREIIENYLREASRVLKPGGVLRIQVNGLGEANRLPNTWWGASVQAHELRQFAQEHGLWLLALEGTGTQYLWATMRKPHAVTLTAAACEMIRVTSPMSSEPFAAARGRYAATAMLVSGLPGAADLLQLRARFDDREGEVVYIGPPSADGVVQVNAILPQPMRTGITQVRLEWLNKRLTEPKVLRIIPEPPSVPRITEVKDAIEIMMGSQVVNGCGKLTLEDSSDITDFRLRIAGIEVTDYDVYSVDARIGGWEINFRLPEGVAPGSHWLSASVGRRVLPPIPVVVGR